MADKRIKATGSPVFDAGWNSMGVGDLSVGKKRFDEFFLRAGDMQANFTFLLASVHMARQAHYSDDFLRLIRQDAADVRGAADAFATFVEDLCDQWEKQREGPIV